MINATIDLARLFIDSYQNKSDRDAGIQRIREAIHRELRLNAELATEAKRIHGEQPDLADGLLAQMHTQSFDALSAAGLPFAKIFPAPWRVSDDPPPAYSSRLESISQVSELVERAYHRTRIQQIRSELGQVKDLRSLRYLAILLGKAAQATKPPL